MGAYIAACGAFGFDPPNVIFHGTQDQIEKYARADDREGRARPSSPSRRRAAAPIPARAIQTRAEKQGRSLRPQRHQDLDFRCRRGDWGIVFARTGESKGRDGITSFIVEKKMQGPQPIKPIPVIRSYSPTRLHFERLRSAGRESARQRGQGLHARRELADPRAHSRMRRR